MQDQDWLSERGAHLKKRALEERHVVPPASTSVAYQLENSQRQFQLDEPSRAMLEENLACAEGAECAVTFASGMGAISAALCNCATAGEHILSHNLLDGATCSLLKNWLPRFGIETSGADFTQLESARRHLRPNTRVLYFESPVNLDLRLIDIAAVAEWAREINRERRPEQRLWMIVDNTLATPYGQRPLRLGADLVVSSLTKNIGGFGADLGGMVAGPSVFENSWMSFRKDFGGLLSPRNAWHFLVYGLPTLPVRFRQQQESAMKLARFLERHPCIEKVAYPGLESFPQRELARRQMQDYDGRFAPGTMIHFRLREPVPNTGENARKFIDYLANHAYAITMAASLGQIRTLVEHPYSMSGAPLDPGGIRLSVGLEKADDLIHELSEALETVFQPENHRP
ncbi:MAG: PLP-dependent transferase [Candidatus Eremiobacteraeota bacterium]|nr:PLP-dependent transferase [Candidatus Eremiobacteraeota bacterium]